MDHFSAILFLVLLVSIVLLRVGLALRRTMKQDADRYRAEQDEAKFEEKLAEERKAGLR